MRIAPVASKCRCSSLALPSGTTRMPAAMTTSPMGTLMRKIAGQLATWVSTPPRSTPTAPPRPPMAPHAASARLRSRPSVNDVVRIASVAGEMIAAPKPCSARAPSRVACESATAQSREARVNRTVPARKTRRRPSRSAARPPSRRKPAKVSVYALTTHCRPVVV